MAKKHNKSGADAAPTFPAKLTAVAAGAAPLEIDEVIDRLYEVASGSTLPTTYGLSTREKAEEALSKLGKAGKAALARAMAHRAAEVVNKAKTPAPAPAALDPAGPNDDFVLEDAGGEGSASEEPETPELPEVPSSADVVAEEAESTPASTPITKPKAERIKELRTLGRAGLRALILAKEYGDGSGAETAHATLPRDPQVRAVARFSKATTAVRVAFSAIDPAVFPAGSEAAAADAFGALTKIAASCEAYIAASASTPAPRTPRAPRAPRAPRVEKPSVTVGGLANVAAKFAARYEDALSAEEMRGLTVTAIRRGLAVCTTSTGEEARLPYAHLEAAVA